MIGQGPQVVSSCEVGAIVSGDPDISSAIVGGVEDEIAAMGASLVTDGGGDIPSISAGMSAHPGIVEVEIDIDTGDEAISKCSGDGVITSQAAEDTGPVIGGGRQDR